MSSSGKKGLAPSWFSRLVAGLGAVVLAVALGVMGYNKATTGSMMYTPLHLDTQQWANVRECYDAGSDGNVPAEPRVAAIAAMLGESNAYNLAGDGDGARLPDEVAKSAHMDNDGVAEGNGSALGVLQWIHPYRGDVSQLMDVSWSCKEFYRLYGEVSSEGDAPEDVGRKIAETQLNAVGPEAYTKHIGTAEKIVKRLAP